MLGEYLNGTNFVFLVGLILAIWSVFHIYQSSSSPLAKALWIVAVLFLPLLGFLAWLFFGPRSAKQKA
ncbi:MAG: PLD nuclease N-terminal domain-containing protein [Terricaulis silvestris]